MLGFFERLTNPFPDKEPTQPPLRIPAKLNSHSGQREHPDP